MPFFPCAHAGHPLWQHATRQVIVQLQAQISMQPPTVRHGLGLVYVSASLAAHAAEIVGTLAQALPQVQHWAGCAAHSVLAGDMDYGHTGAVAVMLPVLAPGDYQLFSDITTHKPAQPGVTAQAALVHGDAAASVLVPQLIELARQLECPDLLGGLGYLGQDHAQWAWGSTASGRLPATVGGGGVQKGGLSGVLFGPGVELLSVGIQGCRPMGPSHTVTHAEGAALLALDGRPALEVLFGHLNWQEALAAPGAAPHRLPGELRQTLLALSPPHPWVYGASVALAAHVLSVVGIDPLRQAVFVEGLPQPGQSVTLCQADEQAARAEVRRACAEIGDWLAPEPTPAQDGQAAAIGRSICGAIYIRSALRHPVPRSAQVDAELQLIRHALGPVPLLGFTSTYEVDGTALQQMSAQLLVFTQPLQALT
ncbi:FIST C-terminal domain-containing protein [Comamonas aquatica]|uniref:FIST C-terminal domain-containing protein n=1 Tax=Comamonas aquatica TaxID=225991 RepID=A0AA43AWP3_9BURK|nr:FIST N-terminal domain-containing protein [Comamonas aquatica]MDH1427051.1 FIST C-terminal domain-containing protein [Comamonas aquatica]MDH1605576.1 FIST C-terminal domain-containing protein [Comamonas aquatica]MDH1617563.1 FIST C-terminal domain-containing protein [Comamonas aquatica]MDH1764387.1 FIST C-terminal domain-containing protein [Comamonas aquatica]MDH2005532.1 FIST C-terminal domain-containing protein [Comamonas aquatica]